MRVEDIIQIREKLNSDIMRVDVKYNLFCTYISIHKGNNEKRADKLISEATTQYKTIQHLYNQIIELIRQIIIEDND
jgi:hypothetical protein